jgi:hypothetical protein
MHSELCLRAYGAQSGRVIFKEITENLWVFEFSERDDLRRVMDGRPWTYDRYILVLNLLNGSIPPSQMVFTSSPFWVQIHDMPLLCMNKEVGSKIGQSLGEVLSVDMAGNGGGWGVLRIRVILDLSKPLERGRTLQVGGTSCWVSFKYEKLPLFCFTCGCILHGSAGCSGDPRPLPRKEGEADQWGVWLRADEKHKLVGASLRNNHRDSNSGRRASLLRRTHDSNDGGPDAVHRQASSERNGKSGISGSHIKAVPILRQAFSLLPIPVVTGQM